MDGRFWTLRRGEPIHFDVPQLPRPDTTKHTAGFPLQPWMDLLDLFIGSEGTLGVDHTGGGAVAAHSRRSALGSCLLSRPTTMLWMLSILGAARSMVSHAGICRCRARLTLFRPAYPDIPRGARAALLIEQQIEDESEYDAWEDRLSSQQALTEASWFAASEFDRERFRRFRHALPEAVNDLVGVGVS